MKQQRKMFLARSAMTLLLAVLTTVTAWAETVSTYYIDENGTRQNVTATVLTGSEATLGSNGQTTWYVVNSNISHDGEIICDGDVNIILADDKTMIATRNDGYYVIWGTNNIAIYGQTKGTGKLDITGTGSNCEGISARSNLAIYGGTISAATCRASICARETLTISGGIINADSSSGHTFAIYGNSNVIISGGTVTATGGTMSWGINTDNEMTISGGKITAIGRDGYAGIRGETSITLGLTHTDDYINANGYQGGTVMIAGGQTLRDEDGNAYTGTLTSDQIAAIADKTLTLSGVSSEQDIVVSYIDANDEEQTVMALPLNGDETALAPGWYVVQNTNPDGVDLAYTNGLSCAEGNLNIILCDGAEMTVNNTANYDKGIEFSGDHTLTIYGQSESTGRLTVTCGKWGNAIEATNIIINGGNINATNVADGNQVIDVNGSLIINGGTVSATSVSTSAAIGGSVILNDGQLTVSNTYDGENSYYAKAYEGELTVNGGQFVASSSYGCAVAGTTTRFNGGTFRATTTQGFAVASSNVYLNWTSSSDSFYASSFDNMSPEITEGKVFIDEKGNLYQGYYDGDTYYGNIYGGDLAGKTLRPFNGCYSPKNLTATAITTSSATLTWEAGDDETQWQMSWSTDGGSTWTTPVTVNSTQYEMTNLDSETTFQVQVVSVYGEGQYSYPSSITFTTHSASDAPVELSSNATVNTATLSWTGFQENYNVRYAVSLENVEDFEDEATFADWTTISNNEANSSGDNGYGIYDNCFRFSSYNFAEDYNQYLISPELNGMLSMEFKYRTSGNGETFRVGYSTTGKDVADFTFGNEIATSSAEWVMYSCTLPAGTKYVAINYYSNYQYYLYVDDITFKSAGSWENVNNTTSPLAITGLTPQTNYLWQVQGILDNDVTEWSTGMFTTLEGASITFAKEGYGTYYNSERDVVLPAGMKARIVTENKGEGKLAYETVANGDTEENTVPAGTAVMLQVAPAEATQTGTIGLATPEAEAISQTNLLHGSDESTMTTGGEKYYKLTYNLEGADKVIGWYWGAADGAAFTIGAHKAWLALSTEQAARPMLSLPAFDDVTTDIVPTTNCTNHTNSTDDWYTIDGRKLNGKPTTKGIYLNGGRKIVVK